MLFGRILVLVSALLPFAAAQACAGSAKTGSASADKPFWMETIKHQGTAPYNGDASYKVFRNVKDFGAKGDGKTDDTDAINKAISDGNGRCGGGKCPSSTTAPAVVYFPAGTYVVSKPLNVYYYTQLIGDGRKPPTLQASSSFAGMAVIDADPYLASGDNWYTNQNNFFKSVRNFVIDLTKAPSSGTTGATALHWQVSQGTSLMNIRVEMGKGSQHQGMFMENGSGGFMGDLIFNGGKIGMWLGNQQFTVRNVSISDASTAIFAMWNWGWTFQGVTINNAQVGFDLTTGGLTTDKQTVGGEAIIDAVISNTPIGIRSSVDSAGSLKGSLVLNNVKLNNVKTAVSAAGKTVLEGGSTTIASWGQGNVYTGTSQTGKFTQDKLVAGAKDKSLLDSAGRIFGRTHPQYADYDVSQFVSARSAGAKGDGTTDDTKALQKMLDDNKDCKVIFLDAGVYIITDTLVVPAGTRMVGEGWSSLMGSGAAFGDMKKPKVVVQVGKAGDKGTAEFTDIIFTTRAPTPGAIVVEWNIAGDAPGAAGMWDSHIRLGGAKGTNTDVKTCPSGTKDVKCTAAYLSMHLTATSSAYLEGTWVWAADHDMEDTAQGQTSVFAGRGILSESAGPMWFIGTASEHHALYQYSLVGAKNHYMGSIQTETPYYQPDPAPPTPFTVDAAFKDPQSSEKSAWGLWVEKSQSIFVLGAGHYSFFQNYKQDCLKANTCQNQIVNIDDVSTIALYQLATVGVVNSLSVNQKPVISASKNVDGIQDTVTAWTRS